MTYEEFKTTWIWALKDSVLPILEQIRSRRQSGFARWMAMNAWMEAMDHLTA